MAHQCQTFLKFGGASGNRTPIFAVQVQRNPVIPKPHTRASYLKIGANGQIRTDDGVSSTAYKTGAIDQTMRHWQVKQYRYFSIQTSD